MTSAYHPLAGLDVKTVPPAEQIRKGPRPSAKQLNLIIRLLKERDTSGLPKYADVEIDAGWLEENLTGGWGGTASELIDALFNAPRKTDNTIDIPEGIHYLDGTVYKVQVAHHGSGRKYAKKLITEDGFEGWEYIGRGATFQQLSADTLMTLEDAQEFGRLYGMCCKCGATLTDESSIAAGIGPVCAQSF